MVIIFCKIEYYNLNGQTEHYFKGLNISQISNYNQVTEFFLETIYCYEYNQNKRKI